MRAVSFWFVGDDMVPTAAGGEDCRVLVVDEDPGQMERILRQGRLICPGCSGQLAGVGVCTAALVSVATGSSRSAASMVRAGGQDNSRRMATV